MLSQLKSGSVIGIASLVATFGLASSAFAAPANTSFTDDNFFDCILLNYNNHNQTSLTNLTDEQLASIEALACQDSNISNTTGIDKLTRLTALDLSSNNITAIDLSDNTRLQELDLSDNQLTSLDLSQNTSLGILDATGNSLTELDLTANRAMHILDVDGDVAVTGYTPDDEEGDEGDSTKDDSTKPTTNPAEEKVEECKSVVLSDEQIGAMKGLLAAYSYDVSKFNATAVKIAASQINMCDGASREEIRALFNAMGVTDLSDEELDAYAKQFTDAYNAAKDGKSLEEVLGLEQSTGVLVPNTGSNTKEGLSAAVAAISLGGVAILASALYMARYGIKRRSNRVKFIR